ncbi:hypothetical protein AAG570_012322 [Ranatra chinensis]|uniref:UBA domain-containing protein n=1 Tax=Ranatra chinensis TaxID=642074 RepID=A0ABD0YIG2_9HEMI
MTIELESMDLFPGIRHTESKSYSDIELGSYCVERKGSSLLTETCHLRIHVERNLMPLRHLVPDLSIQGTLSTLAATLSLEDYKMLNGILLYNIGECLDDLNLPQEITNIDVDEAADVWTVTYMNFELVDVSVRLIPSKGTPLTCINFIKSRLIVENFSNKTQDIDLISQEILITDTRFSDEPANKRSNVFTNILQPIYSENVVDSVQAQVHHRKRLDLSKFTILLNNMRLMAILDWWESVQEFIMTKPDVLIPVLVSMNNQMHSVTEPSSRNDVEVPFELKLNITDSEIVVVEDSSQWDSNAVILKSTTVVTYRPIEIDKPISCNLNHCEMFSCLLGMEDETALSIIDPVTINMEIVCIQNSEGTINKILKIQMVHLSLRLSYNDMKMFSQMLQSLPKQTQAAKKHVSLEHPVNFQNQLEQLKALGFRMEDCYKALNQCGGQLDDAALWLTQNATPASYKSSLVNSPTQEGAQSIFSFNNLEVQTDGVSICVIDDCGDVDVPFMEFLLTDLKLNHDMDIISGTARAVLAAHYYNRLLSGWEPFVEPWSFTVCWDHCVSSSLTKSRMEWHIASVDALNFNVTGSLVELYRTVKDSWTQDYYTPKEILHNRSEGKSPPGYRRRSPFVPFALRNDTGAVLWYATIIGIPDEDLHWILVEPGATVPFSFHEQGKLRHIETHNLKTHQITIRVDGWCRISPVSVDKVGIYFRQTSCDLSSGNSEGLPQARIVLEVTLEGSARKVVTVRSALQIKNHLNHTVEVKLDHAHLYKGTALHLTITPESTLSVPLMYAMAKIWTRPLKFNGPAGHYHTFCTKPLDWHCVNQPGEVIHESKLCPSSWGQSYRSVH